MDDPPHRQRLTLKPGSPLDFGEFLMRRWADGDRVGRRLFHDVRTRGYVGSVSNLERLLPTWRRGARPQTSSRPQRAEPTQESPAIDPATGWRISPMVAASLCMKPTPTLTPSEAAKVAALREASPSFVTMRRLAMRFRGLLRGSDPRELDRFIDGARRSGVPPLQQFARTLTPRHRGRETCHCGAMEQRPGRRSDQPTENSQARYVRPRGHRTLAGANAPAQSRKVTQSPIECQATLCECRGVRIDTCKVGLALPCILERTATNAELATRSAGSVAEIALYCLALNGSGLRTARHRTSGSSPSLRPRRRNRLQPAAKYAAHNGER